MGDRRQQAQSVKLSGTDNHSPRPTHKSTPGVVVSTIAPSATTGTSGTGGTLYLEGVGNGNLNWWEREAKGRPALGKEERAGKCVTAEGRAYAKV